MYSERELDSEPFPNRATGQGAVRRGTVDKDSPIVSSPGPLVSVYVPAAFSPSGAWSHAGPPAYTTSSTLREDTSLE